MASNESMLQALQDMGKLVIVEVKLPSKKVDEQAEEVES